MTMVSTGPISIGGSATSGGLNQSINIELGRAATATSSLNEAALRTLAGVPSGAISLSNFYGKSNTFAFTLTGSNINLRNAAIAAGWNQSTAVQATINNGVIVSASSTGTPAITVDGSWPGGVTLINNGTIAGMGGGGGVGRSATVAAGVTPPTPPGGSSGGTALSVSVPISIQNNGTVAGGGGGGGGGAGLRAGTSRPTSEQRVAGGGGGGGRTGNTNSAGGAGGTASGGSTGNVPGTAGSSGTSANGGAGGPGGVYPNPGTGAAYGTAGTGGAGGAYGSTGSTGGNIVVISGPSQNIYPATAGGGGGPCTSGNSFITWTVVGTRLGALN